MITASLPRLRDAADLAAIESEPLETRALAKTTWQIVRDAAAAWPDATAMTWIPDPQRLDVTDRISFAELHRRVTQVANAFTGLGLGRSDAVSFLSPNVSGMLTAMLGAQACAIASPINPAFDVDRVADLIGATDSRTLVVAGPEIDADRWSGLLAAAARLGVTSLLALRPDLAPTSAPALGSHSGVTVAFLDEVLAGASALTLSAPEPTSSDVASFFHTGGTTGTPKVAAHTHLNEAVMAWDIAVGTGLGPASAILAGLPLFHVNGTLVTGLAPILAGARSVWPGSLGWRDPALLANAWKVIEREEITAMSAVPTVYARLAATPVDADIRTLTTPIVGAAPLPRAVALGFAARTGVDLLQGYGLTEAGCASAFTPHGRSLPGSVGQRLPYQQMAAARIDGDCVELLPAGTVGEIVIAGPTVFAGYVSGESTHRHFDSSSIVGGWLRTGDLGSVGADGTVALRGRSKDLIIRGGHNIDPETIEDAVLSHPDVIAAAAIGRPDRHAGEVPVAYAVPAPEAHVSPSDIVDWAATRIGESAARPVEVILIDALPMTVVGKIFKPELRVRAIRDVVEREITSLAMSALVVDVALDDGVPVVALCGERESVRTVAEALDGYAFDVRTVEK